MSVDNCTNHRPNGETENIGIYANDTNNDDDDDQKQNKNFNNNNNNNNDVDIEAKNIEFASSKSNNSDTSSTDQSSHKKCSNVNDASHNVEHDTSANNSSDLGVVFDKIEQSQQQKTSDTGASCAQYGQQDVVDLAMHIHAHHQQQQQEQLVQDQKLLACNQQECQQQQEQQSPDSSTTQSTTLNKGILWQLQSGKFTRLFNRWKKRYFVLTPDYLVCFKKSPSKVGHSEMGSFLYKTCLVDVNNITWADKKKNGVICLKIANQPYSLVLWSSAGLDDWMYALKGAVDRSKGRREALVRKSQTLSPTLEKQLTFEQENEPPIDHREKCITTHSSPSTLKNEQLNATMHNAEPRASNQITDHRSSDLGNMIDTASAAQIIEPSNRHPLREVIQETQASKRLLSPTAASGRLLQTSNKSTISSKGAPSQNAITTSTINRMRQHLSTLSSMSPLNTSQECSSNEADNFYENGHAIGEINEHNTAHLSSRTNEVSNISINGNNNSATYNLKSSLESNESSPHNTHHLLNNIKSYSGSPSPSSAVADTKKGGTINDMPQPRQMIRRDDSWQSLLSLSQINQPRAKLFTDSHQRSIYAQHIMDNSSRQQGHSGRQNSSSVSTPTKSRVPLRSDMFDTNQRCLSSQLTRQPVPLTPSHQRQSNAYRSTRPESSTNGYSSSRSQLKSATSEFCFIRPNSPTMSTLPHPSRSMQFSGEFSAQSSGVISNNPNMDSSRPMHIIDATHHIEQQQMAPINDLEAPGRELPLKPNRKRQTQKKSQQSSLNFSGLLRRAFKIRSKNTADVSIEPNIVFDHSNLPYTSTITSNNSIQTNQSGPRILDMINAFTQHTLSEDAGYGTAVDLDKPCYTRNTKIAEQNGNISHDMVSSLRKSDLNTSMGRSEESLLNREPPNQHINRVREPLQFSPQPQPRHQHNQLVLTPSSRRRQQFLSNGRPSSIYGLPSMVSSVSSGLSDRVYHNPKQFRNSHHSRDNSIVVRLPSLDTTREVAEEVISPSSEYPPCKMGNMNGPHDSSYNFYDNNPPIHSVDGRYMPAQLSLERNPKNDKYAVVVPFQQSPTHANIYDNHHPNEISAHSFYDNQPNHESLYRFNGVSDSVPSHLCANANESNLHRMSFVDVLQVNQSPSSRATYRKPAAIVAPTSPPTINHSISSTRLQSKRTVIHVNQSPLSESPGSYRRATGSHQITRSQTSHHVSPIFDPRMRRDRELLSNDLTESVIDLGGVKLEPKLAASLLGTDFEGSRNFDSLKLQTGKFVNHRNTVGTNHADHTRAFLVSTRLTKSICNNNSQLSTPSRYIQSDKANRHSTGLQSRED